MFIPLKDNRRTLNVPILTIALIVVNCLVFITFESNAQNTTKTIILYGAVPYELTHSGTQCVPDEKFESVQCAPTAEMERRYQTKFPSTWETVASSMFLHGGWLHLIGNMLFLFVFGRAVEDALGRLSFLCFYVVGGIAAALGHTLYDMSSQLPMVGASGAIAAVMGAYLVLYPRAKVSSLFALLPFFVIKLRAWFIIGTWLLEQMLLAWQMAGGAQGGTAVFAHFGGFLVGCALTYLVIGRAEIEEQRLRAKFTSDNDKIVGLDSAGQPLPSGYFQPHAGATVVPAQVVFGPKQEPPRGPTPPPVFMPSGRTVPSNASGVPYAPNSAAGFHPPDPFAANPAVVPAPQPPA